MPRKTLIVCQVRLVHGCASMRPRPDAAENAGEAARANGNPILASMRPRPDAAENAVRPLTVPPVRRLQ